MKLKIIALVSTLSLASCQTKVSYTQQEPNTLSAYEKEHDWLLLFDGKTSGSWRGYRRIDFPSNWQVINGTLHMKGVKNMTQAELVDRSDIIYDKKFKNFILMLDWKISENGNSGIFYLGQEHSKYSEQNNDYIWRTAPEMQILDNDGHPDANKGRNGNRQAGSLYDLIPAKPQNAMPVGQWNKIEITVNDRFVTHKQNGEVVVSYQMDSKQWQDMISKSKFPALNPYWHEVAQQGYIGLQDHDDEVWFRNIKIKAL